MKTEIVHGEGYVRIELKADTEFDKALLAIIHVNAKWETPVIVPDQWGYDSHRSSNYQPIKVSEVRLIHTYAKPEPKPESA